MKCPILNEKVWSDTSHETYYRDRELTFQVPCKNVPTQQIASVYKKFNITFAADRYQ